MRVASARLTRGKGSSRPSSRLSGTQWASDMHMPTSAGTGTCREVCVLLWVLSVHGEKLLISGHHEAVCAAACSIILAC